MGHPDHEALLRVQESDTEADQVRHRRGHSAEGTAVKAAETTAVAAKAAYDTLAAEVAELTTRQETLEGEIDRSEHRAVDIDTRMRSGEITAARDIVRMQAEIDHLRQRAAELEEQGMEVLVAFDERDEALVARRTALDAAIDAVIASRLALAAVETECDARLATLDEARAALVAEVPAALLDQYERLRARSGGVGAARLDGDQCLGCHLHLSPRDIDNAKRMPADVVLQCDSCGRILVRR